MSDRINEKIPLIFFKKISGSHILTDIFRLFWQIILSQKVLKIQILLSCKFGHTGAFMHNKRESQ